jgi:hypothetical protein
MITAIEQIPTHWFDKGVALQVVRHYFKQGSATIRIAVGFFTVRGYNLIRASATGKKMYILVGVNEPGEDKVRRVVVKEIMNDLRTGIDEDRRAAVVELVSKMEGGQFRIIDAHALDHHAKLYIIDDNVALVGSANISGRGLIEAIEAGYTITDRQHVADFLGWYDDHFYSPACVDITQALLDALKRWLNLVRPWDIYLKTLDALRALEEPKLQRSTYLKPVGFQTDVIARALRQLEEHCGAIVIASTGLGKTVIASDVTLRLKEAEIISNVLVIGPKAVERSWYDHLAPTGIYTRFFNPSALDAADAARNRHWQDLAGILETMDDQWLIIIDESHIFRKEQQEVWVDGRPTRVIRRAFKRLLPAIKRSGARVLLLTGTPLSTGIENVNSQLRLLPHNAPAPGSETLFSSNEHRKAWRVRRLADLKTLPVSSAITTPYVARHYGLPDEINGGIYIDYNGQRRYIPQVMLYRINAPLPLEEAITTVLDHGYFTTMTKGMYQGNIERQVRLAWGSSPWALRDTLSKSINRPGWEKYNVQFKMDVEVHRRAQQYIFDFTGATTRRQERLEAIIEQLEQMRFTDDPKLMLLIDLLKNLLAAGQKVAIFSERWATVAYLETAIRELLPTIPVASLINLVKPGHYKAKKDREIEELLFGFAPVANGGKTEDSKYDVFLATDAYGVGINMQDAQVVINYDLAWTPIEPAQRAGRVLRFWHHPRIVALYAFVPTPQNKYSEQAAWLARRWENLADRHRQAQTLLDMPTLTTQTEPEAVDMSALAGPAIEALGTLDLAALDTELDREVEEENEGIPVSPIFRHLARLEGYREEVRHLPDDLSSAMIYHGNQPLVYVLLRYKSKYEWGLYNLKQQKLLPKFTDLKLLDLIECEESTPTAIIDASLVDRAGNTCIQAWCEANNIAPEEVTRICTLLLTPESGQIEDLLMEVVS